MTESATAAPETGARWEDYYEIFTHPARVFTRRERSNFLVPLLVLVVGVAVLYFVTADLIRPMIDAEISRGMANAARQNPELTAEQLERGRGMARTFAGVSVVVFTLVGPVLTGLVLWLVGKFVGAAETLGTALVVAAFAFYPRLIEMVLNAGQALMLPEEALDSRYSLSIGPARFLDPDTAAPLALALLGRLDLFTIWVTVLLAIGLRVTGRVSTGQAAIAGAVVWLVGAIPALFGAMRMAAAG